LVELKSLYEPMKNEKIFTKILKSLGLQV